MSIQVSIQVLWIKALLTAFVLAKNPEKCKAWLRFVFVVLHDLDFSIP